MALAPPLPILRCLRASLSFFELVEILGFGFQELVAALVALGRPTVKSIMGNWDLKPS